MRACELFGKRYVWVRVDGRLELVKYEPLGLATGGPITLNDLLAELGRIGETGGE